MNEYRECPYREGIKDKIESNKIDADQKIRQLWSYATRISEKVDRNQKHNLAKMEKGFERIAEKIDKENKDHRLDLDRVRDALRSEDEKQKENVREIEKVIWKALGGLSILVFFSGLAIKIFF